MRVALLGANGRTGRRVLARLLEAGDEVTAIVRTEERLADVEHPLLSVCAGDVCDPRVLEGALPGHDVVISTLGPRMPTRATCAIYPESAAAVVEAMKNAGVNRILVVSTALLFPSRGLFQRVLRWVARHNARHASRMEETLRESGLDWTIVRVGFLENAGAESFQHSVGAFPEKGGSIPRAALARFLVTEAREDEHLREVVGLWG